MKKLLQGLLLSTWVGVSLFAADMPSKTNPVALYQGVIQEVESQQGTTTNFQLWKAAEQFFSENDFTSFPAISAHGEEYPYSIDVQQVRERVDPRTLQSSFSTSYVPLVHLGALPDSGVILVSRKYLKKENDRIEEGTVVIRILFRTDTETKARHFKIQSVQTHSGPPEGLRMKSLGNSSGAGG